MKKLLKNIIYIIGVTLLTIVFILNLAYTSEISSTEIITINPNTAIYLVGTLVITYMIWNICKILRHKATKIKKKHIILGIIIIIYVIAQIIWINYRNACPAVDQKTTYQVAVRNGRRKLKRSNTKWNNLWSKTSKYNIS